MDGGEIFRMTHKISSYNSWVGHTPMFNDDVSSYIDENEQNEEFMFDDPGLSILTSSKWNEMSYHKFASKTMQQRLRDEWSEDEQV